MSDILEVRDTVIAKLEATQIELETILGLIEDAATTLKNLEFRHNDVNTDFVGTEDDENAILEAAHDLAKAVGMLKPIAGY